MLTINSATNFMFPYFESKMERDVADGVNVYP